MGRDIILHAGNDIFANGNLTSGRNFNFYANHNFANGGYSTLESGADFNIHAGNDITTGHHSFLTAGTSFNINTGHDYIDQYRATLKSGTSFNLNAAHDIVMGGDPFLPIYTISSGASTNLHAGHDYSNGNAYLRSGASFNIDAPHAFAINGRQGGLKSAGDFSIKTGDFRNFNGLSSGGNLTINSQGNLFNIGFISASKNMNIYAGMNITNPRMVTESHRGGYLQSLNGNITANAKGDFTNGYIIEADKGNILLHGNTVSNNSITDHINAIENSNITAARKLTINSDHDLVNSASIKSGGDLALRTGTNTIVHNAQQVTPGSFQNIIGAPGAFPNTPHNVVSTNGKVTITATKDILNETTIQGHGNVSLSVGTTNPSGTVVVLPGKITNTGTITSDTGTVIENTHP